MTECTLFRGGEPYEYRLANADPGLKRVGIARGAQGNAALAVAVLITQWRASNSVRPSGARMAFKLAPPAPA
jgi:hypothetical protein